MTKWYQRGPSPQEVRASDPGRKDRLRWCGGHVGRQHQVVVAIPPNCRWRCKAPGDWYLTLRRTDLKPWWCHHVELCTVCGKQLRPIRWQDCPDRPSVSG